jgi:hypothetical protein
LKQLPIIAMVKEAILLVWLKRFVVFRALVATGIVMAVLDVATLHFGETLGWFGSLLLSLVVYPLVFTLYAVTCHRLVLLGDASVPRYGLHSWTSRETRFLGWGVVIGLYALLVFAAAAAIVFAVSFSLDEQIRKYAIPPVWISAGLLAVYLFARLAVLLPAAAVGERHNTDWAFDTTAKNSWRLVGAVVLIPALPGLILFALPLEHNLLTDFVSRLVDYTLGAVGIAVLSLSFRFLTSPETAQAKGDTQS